MGVGPRWFQPLLSRSGPPIASAIDGRKEVFGPERNPGRIQRSDPMRGGEILEDRIGGRIESKPTTPTRKGMVHGQPEGRRTHNYVTHRQRLKRCLYITLPKLSVPSRFPCFSLYHALAPIACLEDQPWNHSFIDVASILQV